MEEDNANLASRLAALPSVLLSQILTTPEDLWTALHLNSALRAALVYPQADALWPLWCKLITQRCDPASALSLASPRTGDGSVLTEEQLEAARVERMYDGPQYRRDVRIHGHNVKGYAIPPDLYQGPHASFSPQRLGQPLPPPPTSGRNYAWEAATALADHAGHLRSWAALVHVLLSSACVACGAKTRHVSWVEGDGSCGPARCCSSCILQPPSRAPGPLQRISAVVLNPSFFDRTPFADIDAGAPGALGQLQAALKACPEGGSISLSGRLESDWRDSLSTAGCAAVRLVGKPPPSPRYTPMHLLALPEEGMTRLREVSPQVEAPRRELLDLEAAAAADVGCPRAALVLPLALEVECPLFLEGIHICTGNWYECGKLGYPHELGDPIGGGGDICDGVSVRGDAATPLLLSQCWITAHSGTGLVLDSGAHASLSRCVLSNCLGAAVACNSGATLRMAGCHVVSNNLDICAGAEADFAALASANTFRANLPVPGTIDAFCFPVERAHIPPHNLMPSPDKELAPWSPAFTVYTGGLASIGAQFDEILAPGRSRPPPIPPPSFPRVVNVALLS